MSGTAAERRLTLAGAASRTYGFKQQPLRYEFDGLQPVAMTGGTAAHAALQRNLIAALAVRLRGKPCQPYGSELKIQVAGRIRYPDAFVICTPINPKDTVAREPVVVFELLNESTSDTDLVIKNQEYRATPSIQRYVILEQTNAGALVFARKDSDWVSEIVSGTDALLSLPEIGIEIPLAELYESVKFRSRSCRTINRSRLPIATATSGGIASRPTDTPHFDRWPAATLCSESRHHSRKPMREWPAHLR